MKQGPRNEDAPRPDPAAGDARSYGGEDSRRVQGHVPKLPHYDPSGRWAERPGADPYREEQEDARQRFARGAEWDFRPDTDGARQQKGKR